MLVIVFMAAAMPTEREYAEARSVVTELMSGPVAEQKAGRLTHVQVGKKAMELVDSAETDAADSFYCRTAAVVNVGAFSSSVESHIIVLKLLLLQNSKIRIFSLILHT